MNTQVFFLYKFAIVPLAFMLLQLVRPFLKGKLREMIEDKNTGLYRIKIKKSMKKIEAIIRKSKFDEVKKALHNVGVVFFSYWDVTGVGNEKQGHVYRGVVYSTSDIQRRYLSIVVSDDFVETTVNTIMETAKTGNVGDGKIFVSSVEEAYRIRTGESGYEGIN
jgi:nitrogen regulatory protein P-II 1